MRIVKNNAWLLPAIMVAIAISAASQTPNDRKLIEYAKGVPVSQLDSKLPAIPFERWLAKEAGAGAQISWEVNDCGEQTGTPEDAENDFPVCVEANAKLADKRVVVVSIAIGTYHRGIYGKPATWWITVGSDPHSDKPLKTLSEVPAAIGGARGTPPPKPARELPPGKPTQN